MIKTIQAFFLCMFFSIIGYNIGVNKPKPFEVKNPTVYFQQDEDGTIYQIHRNGDTLAIGKQKKK